MKNRTLVLVLALILGLWSMAPSVLVPSPGGGLAATAGTGNQAATVLTEAFNDFTVVPAGGDTVLPPAVAGLPVFIYNSDASDVLSVWPSASDAINTLAVDTAFGLPVSTMMFCLGLSDALWSCTFATSSFPLSNPTSGQSINGDWTWVTGKGITLEGGEFNTGHLRMGTMEIWLAPSRVDGTGGIPSSLIRVAEGTPGTELEGAAIVMQTGSAFYGPTAWCDGDEATTDTGTECCALMGMACQTTFAFAIGAQSVVACGVDTATGMYLALCK